MEGNGAVPALSPIATGASRYSKVGLLSVFFWMLWGDLCVNIMETFIPRMVPLHLQRLQASSAVIGLVTYDYLIAERTAPTPSPKT